MRSTFQFSQNFQVRFNVIFSEKIIQYSRTFALQVQTSWNQAHAPLLVESFPKIPRTRSKASWFGGSHNYKTKQSVFIDRLVWHVLLAQVLSCPQLVFPSKTWLFGIYLNFQWQKSLKNQHLPHFESKSYQINSIKSCSSGPFQEHQRHIPILPKFSGKN